MSQVEQGIGLTGIGCEGFLAEYRLAGVYGKAGMLKVVGVGSGNIYKVNLRVLYHLLV